MNPSQYSLVFLVLLAVASSSCEAVITCEQAVGDVNPCVMYLIGPTGAKPPLECCDGVKALVAATPTPEDSRVACVCLKVLAQSIPINPKNAQDLPRNCNVNLSFEITPGFDCNR
ncbi:hypothetical protein QN277_010266 [Acacia crassicarpa]|uniref:Non-specific lipid-transfer protein n=1 Tax=Acacia crassicarpa TaxID=499986 RepID=A0AAE1MBI5_9FABA|nr:hypothetical protein QN277_010264 [Acacia crassicarpa]KAK4253616.1 hypothetical protein QN277_010266 [Acacia crassicarpa]